MTVKVFTIPTCPWCVKVKDFLVKNKVQFQEVDVVEDLKAQREMIERSGQMGVPVVEIDGKMIVGFEPEALFKALSDVVRVSKVVVQKAPSKPVKKNKPKKESLVKVQNPKLVRRW